MFLKPELEPEPELEQKFQKSVVVRINLKRGTKLHLGSFVLKKGTKITLRCNLR